MSALKAFCVILSLSVFLGLSDVALAVPNAEMTGQQTKEEDDLKELNNQIRREKFDLVLPIAMRKNNVDMWIHVMREAIPDPFGAEELGSTSGVFIFTDRGGDRIERAILGRRWGASHRGRVEWETKLVEECGAYDIIGDPVRVQQPVGGPMTEYDYRFKGLREFVVARDPNRIAVNFKKDLGPYVTFRGTYAGATDGISYTDYLLLAEELGDEYAKRLVSSEYVIGIILRDNQLHMVIPKNNYPVYSAGFDPEKTQLSVDCHGMMKGARERPEENYFGPRIGSLGPDWQKDIPLPPNHHFVLEYFFYMPSPTSKEREDQYLFWWDHEQAIATEKGVDYLSPPQKELILIR